MTPEQIVSILLNVLIGASGILLGWLAFGRNRKQDKKQDRVQEEKDIRADAIKEANLNAKLELIVNTVTDIKSNMQKVSDKEIDHDKEFISVHAEIKSVSDRLNEHIQSHE
jgi:Tfp pilus assembly protein PilO